MANFTFLHLLRLIDDVCFHLDFFNSSVRKEFCHLLQNTELFFLLVEEQRNISKGKFCSENFSRISSLCNESTQRQIFWQLIFHFFSSLSFLVSNSSEEETKGINDFCEAFLFSFLHE